MAPPAPTFYVFHGTDEFSISETLADFKRRFGAPEMADLNTTVLDGRDIGLDELRAACDAMPFLADRRLVIVTNLLRRLTARGDRDLSHSLTDLRESLTEYLPQLPETTRLVFVEDRALSPRHPIIKLANEDERGYLRKFDPPAKDALPHWVQERAQGYGAKIEGKAAQELALAVGDDLRLLDQEINKLATYTNGERAITVEDVDVLVPYAQAAVVFDLVDALGQGDSATAARVLHRLLEGPDHPLAIFGMIVRQFRLLVQVKELEQQGASLQDVTKELKLHPFPARKLHVQAIRFTSAQLDAIYHHMLDTDLAIKTGKLDQVLALDLLVAELTSTPA